MNTTTTTSGYICYPCADTQRCLECDGTGETYGLLGLTDCYECWGKGHCLECEIREYIAAEEATSN
jgi:hypothetical protein